MARKALYRNATQVDTSSYPDDGSSPIGSNEWNADPDANGMLGFTPANATITISSGVATITDSISVIASESGTSDDLDKLAITNTNQYDLVYLFADAGDTITLKNTSSPSADGQIKTVSNSDETLSTTSPTILNRKGNHWFGYGGGVVNAVGDIGDVTISSVGDNEILQYNNSSSVWENQTLAEAGLPTLAGVNTFSGGTCDFANSTSTSITSPSIYIGDGGSDAIYLIGTLGSGSLLVKDEDNMASDSATHLVTQQSVKAYVDAQVATENTIDEMNDTTITSIGDNEILQWNNSSSVWENQTLAEAGIQTTITTGIADDNIVEIDHASVADNDYAKFTANGLEGRSATEVKTDLSLNNVENTAISTFAGSTNITTLGTIATGTWSGTAVAETKGGTNQTTYTQGDILYASGSNTLSKLAKGTAGQVLTMNGGATAPSWATSSGGFVATADDDLNFAGLYDVEDLQRACFEIQGTSFDSDSTNNADRTGESQMYVRQVDSNNDGLFIRIKKNGSIQNLQVA